MAEKALALYVDCKLTTFSYNLMRKKQLVYGICYILLIICYKKLSISCYSSEEYITITDTRAEISLQSLIDLSVKNYAIYKIPYLNKFKKNVVANLLY